MMKTARWGRTIVLVLLAWILPHASTLLSAPPAIATKHHPFDSDWPDIYLVLQRKCVGCHRCKCERTDLSSYDALMSAAIDGDTSMKLVVPGKPEESFLWEYVAWNANARAESDLPDTPMMPPRKDAEWLTARQLDSVYRWIKRGAFQYRLPETCENRPLTEIDFPPAESCKPCHPRQFRDWSRSMHAYAQHSPIFEAFNLTLVERTSGTIGTFCTRCHTPIGTALGENESVRNAHRSRISREGVTCVVCHRRKSGHYKSSGRVALEPGSLMDGCFYGPFESSHAKEVGSHHSQAFPYIRSSQFCGECHDVTSPQGVRLEEAYSEWANSPAADQGITCHMCHMGPIQGVPVPYHQRPMGRVAEVPGVDPNCFPIRPLSDHTFAGPDYSMLPDTEFPYKLDWMYEVDYRDPKNLTPYQQRTLVELRRKNRAELQISDSKRMELLQNGAKLIVHMPKQAYAGQRVVLNVDVQSLISGHSYPTGFTAERQLWVFVRVKDPTGRVVFQSGDFDHNRDLRDDHSHDVLLGHLPRDRHLLNFQNKFIALTNKGTERSVFLSVNRHLAPVNILRPANVPSSSFGRPPGFRIAKGSIPPLGKLRQRYPVVLGNCAGNYQVHVALNFRHLPPALLDHIGTPHLKHLLQVVTIDSFNGTIAVQP